MDFFDISVGAWEFTYMLIALIVPVWLSLKVLQLFIGSGKKTFRSIKK